MKKILIDATALSDQYKNRGIGTYAHKIIESVTQDSTVDWHLLGFDDVAGQFDKVEFHKLGEVRSSTPLNLLFFRQKMLPLIEKVGPDLYFAPHFERGLPIEKSTTALVLHDLFPYMHNSYSSQNAVFNFIKGRFYKYNLSRAKKADYIITHANYTKDQLVKIGFDKQKMKVIYLGPGLEFSSYADKSQSEIARVVKKYKLSGQFVMYYGGMEKNKNADKLVHAFSKVAKKSKLKLLISDKGLYFKGSRIVAKNENAQKISALIDEFKLFEKVILPRFIETEDMTVVFDKATCFVHLSSYEGFGFSVVEAMSSGCAVIAADRSCYPEIVGNAALLVDPDDSDTVASHILELSANEKKRAEYERRGEKRAKMFSWEKTAKETLEAFKSIMQ